MNTYSTKMMAICVLASQSWIMVALDPSLRGATTTDDDRRLVGCRHLCKDDELDHDKEATCMAICKASGKTRSKTEAELLDTSVSTACGTYFSQTSADPTILSTIVQESLNNPYIFEYDGGVGDYIVDGFSDMFNGGNAITTSSLDGYFEDPCSSGYMFGSGYQQSTEGAVTAFSSRTRSPADVCCSGYWFDNRIPYTKGEVVNNVFGIDSSYYTVEADGVFVLSVKDATSEWVKVNGMTGRDEYENNNADVEAYDVEVVTAELPYKVFVKSVATSSSEENRAPTIIHVWIIPSDNACLDSNAAPPSHVYSPSPYCDDDMINNPGSKFDYLLVSEMVGHPTQETIQNLVERYLNAKLP